jgi:hypothetical protein
MNPQKTRRILDAVAADHVPEDVNLLPAIRAGYERKTLMKTLRAQPALMILSVLLALVLLSGVAYAAGRLTGFVTGFGFVSDASTTRVLENPIEVTKNGITFLVEKAVSDETRSWLEVSLSHTPYPDAAYDAVILLPDGQSIPLQAATSQESLSDKVPLLFEFPRLPANSGALTLQLKYAHFRQDDWTSILIPLKLRLLRADELIPSQPISSGPRQSKTQGGLTLVLDNVAPASDKTILQVSLRFEQAGMMLNAPWGVILSGDNGKIYPLTEVLNDSNNQSKTYETLPFHGGETLTLSLTTFPESGSLPLSVTVPVEQPDFTFEPGKNSQVGQRWELDERIQVSGFEIRATGAELLSDGALQFEFAPTPNVSGVMLYSPLSSGGEGSIPVENAPFTAKLWFESIPGQPIPVNITRVGYTAHGQWQIHWQAPAAPDGMLIGPTNTPPPTAAVFLTPTAILIGDPLLLQVQVLAQKFDASLQHGPGWIHLVITNEIRQRAGQTFPPPFYTTEQWLELDAEGYVIRSILTDRDKGGTVIQQTVTIGNYFVNFTTGETGYNEFERYLFSADMLTNDLIQAAQYQSQVTHAEEPCDDGTPCLLVTLFDAFAQASQNPGETQEITGMGRKTWVKLDSGQQVKVQAFSQLDDGSQRVEYTQITVIAENVGSPPNEVQKIINSVVRP